MSETTQQFKCGTCGKGFKTQDQLQGHQANQYTDCEPESSESKVDELEQRFERDLESLEKNLMKVEKDQMDKDHDIDILIETLIRVREYLRGHGESKYTHKNVTNLIDQVLQKHGKEKTSRIGRD